MAWRGLSKWAAGAATASLAATMAIAQAQTAPAPKPAPATPKPAPAGQDPMAPLPTLAPVELPPPLWTVADAQALKTYIAGVGREGLDPSDYDLRGLDAAMASGDPAAMSKAATDRFLKLASDLALGHVRGDNRIDWHVVDNDIDGNKQRLLLDSALAQHRVADALNGLLPTHPQYGALRAALARAEAEKAPESKINRIRLNMDRWRWLPRDLGDKYIIVNVPSFHATLVEDGQTRWKNRAIAGAIKTPTPQLSVMATGVILNPWWEVPASITKEVAGKPGYVAVKGKDGKVQRWRQPPGPSNALGQLKFVMQNQWAIYLHDTNARSRFNDQARALSHGCVRTQHVVGLAKELLGDDGGEWTPTKVDTTLSSKKTVEAKFVKPLPVYIVYFSSAALTDGTIVDYQDVYKRDSKVIAALLDRNGDNLEARKANADAAKI